MTEYLIEDADGFLIEIDGGLLMQDDEDGYGPIETRPPAILCCPCESPTPFSCPTIHSKRVRISVPTIAGVKEHRQWNTSATWCFRSQWGDGGAHVAWVDTTVFAAGTSDSADPTIPLQGWLSFVAGIGLPGCPESRPAYYVYWNCEPRNQAYDPDGPATMGLYVSVQSRIDHRIIGPNDLYMGCRAQAECHIPESTGFTNEYKYTQYAETFFGGPGWGLSQSSIAVPTETRAGYFAVYVSDP